MKLPHYLLITLMLVFAGTSMAQTDSTHWSSAYKDTLIATCYRVAVENSTKDTALRYCTCMAEKLEAEFPSEDEADAQIPQYLQTLEGKKITTACYYSGWPKQDRLDFLRSCVDEAISLGKDKAYSYCSCMLIKLEAVYTVDEMNQLGEAILQDPRWTAEVKKCLNAK